MKQLWAPWRMSFIKGKKESFCIFCKFPKDNNDEEHLIVFKGKKNFIILNKYPYNNGHLMIVPYHHTSDFTSLKDSERNEMMTLTNQAVTALKKYYKPEGFNIGMNLGAAAGAGIKDHLHLHIVPRWNGDTNFMPVIGLTKVMPQHLSETYQFLKSSLGRTK